MSIWRWSTVTNLHILDDWIWLATSTILHETCLLSRVVLLRTFKRCVFCTAVLVRLLTKWTNMASWLPLTQFLVDMKSCVCIVWICWNVITFAMVIEITASSIAVLNNEVIHLLTSKPQLWMKFTEADPNATTKVPLKKAVQILEKVLQLHWTHFVFGIFEFRNTFFWSTATQPVSFATLHLSWIQVS